MTISTWRRKHSRLFNSTVDEVIKGDCLRWILVSLFGLACGSPPNDTIQISSAAHRTGHWNVHGASFGVSVSYRLASTAPRHLASLLQKANSAAGGTWPLSGPWRQWRPQRSSYHSPSRTRLWESTLQKRERGANRERVAAPAAAVVVVVVVVVLLRVSSSHPPQSTAKGSTILILRSRVPGKDITIFRNVWKYSSSDTASHRSNIGWRNWNFDWMDVSVRAAATFVAVINARWRCRRDKQATGDSKDRLTVLLQSEATQQSPSGEASGSSASRKFPGILLNPRVHYRLHNSWRHGFQHFTTQTNNSEEWKGPRVSICQMTVKHTLLALCAWILVSEHVFS